MMEAVPFAPFKMSEPDLLLELKKGAVIALFNVSLASALAL